MSRLPSGVPEAFLSNVLGGEPSGVPAAFRGTVPRATNTGLLSNNLTKMLRRLQGQNAFSPLQEAAVDAQQRTRADIERLFANQQRGFEENVGSALRGQVLPERQRLAERGVSESTLGLLGEMGATREHPLILGQLRDALSGNRLNQLSGVSSNLARIFTGSSNQNAGLLSQLLSQLTGLSRASRFR